MKLFLVGGSLRDRLLGANSKDLDYMVEASFEDMKEFVIKNGYIVLHEKPEFLTLRVKIPTGKVVDFACCRTEGDYDGRRPGTVAVTDLNSDLSRRDFTINAMAWEVDPQTFETIGEIIDPFGGKEHLYLKHLSFVGSPQKRFEEDGLRWLRAIRFIITKGLDPLMSTEEALQNATLETMKKVSVERIREELEKCFRYDSFLTMKTFLEYPPLWNVEGLWLKPTLEQK